MSRRGALVAVGAVAAGSALVVARRRAGARGVDNPVPETSPAPPPLDAGRSRTVPTDDGVERQLHALTFWDHVVDAADSMVFRLMFNSLRAAYEPALVALAPLMAEEVGQVGAYRLLTAAIGAGDPETARAAADRVLRPATTSLLTALEALED